MANSNDNSGQEPEKIAGVEPQQEENAPVSKEQDQPDESAQDSNEPVPEEQDESAAFAQEGNEPVFEEQDEQDESAEFAQKGSEPVFEEQDEQDESTELAQEGNEPVFEEQGQPEESTEFAQEGNDAVAGQSQSDGATEPAQDPNQFLLPDDEEDRVALVEKVYQIWWHWADFHLFIISPTIPPISPPVVIPPEPLPDSNELEFVYPIYDHGFKLSTSKSEDMYSGGMAMCKLYYTIEKMIFLLVERLKSSGIDTDTEVQVAFGGHELAQRKAFESIINLVYNVVATNFDPGVWGERYLQVVKLLADKGYGYPPEAPRDIYRHPHTQRPTAKR